MTSNEQDHFMPLPEEVAAKLSTADRYLVSYPRSGRTWLYRCVLIAQQIAESGATPTEAVIREFVRNDHHRKQNLNGQGPDWRNPFATGESLFGFLTVHGWGDVVLSSEGPHLYLFRSPEDVMVSYYNYATFRQFIDAETVSLSEFARGNLPDWISHTKNGISTVTNARENWICLSYESLFAAPSEKICLISRSIGVTVEEATCTKVAKTLTPKFVMESLKSKRPALSASPGRGAQILPQDVLEEIRAEAMPLYRQACQLENV